MRNSKVADESGADRTWGDFDEAVSRITVMIIDKSKTIRRNVAKLLTKDGYQVVTAADGFEALVMIADQRPDIIFLDIAMPRLDGYQACALIKHHKVFGHIPVVMLSSEDAEFDRAHANVVGSEHCINKPFTREELLSAIERYANTKADRDGA